MIKTKKGSVKIKGSEVEIMADLSVIVHHLYHYMLPQELNMTQEEAKETITRAVNRALKTEEELHEETKSTVAEILKIIANDLEGVQ